MAYSKAKLKISGDRTSLCLDHSEQEMYDIDFYLCGFQYRFHLNTFLISLTNFIGILNPMRMLYNTSLLTEP